MTTFQGVTTNPRFSPDGKWIAYWSDKSGEYELCVRRADGTPFKWNDSGDETSEKGSTRLVLCFGRKRGVRDQDSR